MFGLFNKKKKVILVLGGGSARGIAHIGVLKVFEREKIPIDRIIGTSMGALIGGAYAVGISPEEMEKKAKAVSINKLLDPTVPKMGLLAGERLQETIRTLLDDKKFDDCKIPFAAVTTDIETGQEIIHQSGDMTRVVRASCSWPGIFNPVAIDGRLLCDGGIKNSVPTKIARTLEDGYLIAVDVGFCIKQGKLENIFQVILQSFQIMGEELNRYQSGEADLIIKVVLGDLDQTSFERAEEAIKKGMWAAESKLKQIKKDLSL